MKRNKIISFCVILSLLTALLSGCKASNEESSVEIGQGIEKQNKDENITAMGRYVEKTVELPQLFETETVATLIEHQKMLTLYTFLSETEATGTYYVYTMQADGSWEKQEAGWLNEAAGGRNLFLRNMRTDEADGIYTWYHDDSYQVHILKTADGSKFQEIPIKDLTIKENIPNGFAVTGKGDVAISYLGGSSSGEVVLYSGADGSELKRFPTREMPTDNICNYMDASGNRLAVLSEDGKGITVYDTDTGKVADQLTSDLDFVNSSALIQIGKNKEYFLLSPEGLSHYEAGGSIQETLIDGSLNTMGIEGMDYQALLSPEKDGYYVLFKDEESYELVTYVYDEAVTAVPEIRLTMYGLKENKSVSRAIGAFQKENPDVQIVYHTAWEEGAATVADSIRTLNTELLSGKGADIILLDGLPVESYIEKGVLADISDVVKPMMERGELLANITQSYQSKDGAIYGIPVRFSIPLLVGDGKVDTAFLSLEGLRKYAKENSGTEFIASHVRTLTYDELAEFIFHLNYKEIMGDTGKPQREKLVKFLETVQETGNAIGATVQAKPKPPATLADLQSNEDFKLQYPEYYSLFELGMYPTEDGTMMSTEIKGVIDMMEPLTLKAEFGRTLTPVNGSYIPTGTIGINSASAHVDRAKGFLKCVLSEKEQSKDMQDGMPVQVKALEGYCNKESKVSSSVGYLENGIEKMISFESPTKEEIASITDMAKTLTTPLHVDEVFKEMILSEARPFFAGSVSAEKAADAIFTKAGTYLAE